MIGQLCPALAAFGHISGTFLGTQLGTPVGPVQSLGQDPDPTFSGYKAKLRISSREL